jgi:uncharacterized membrane protein YkvA (DUF1232 family)
VRKRLRTIADALRHELSFYQLVLKDGRTPRIAWIALGLAVGYALLPFDLIPDWIPIIGHLDDLIIVPILIIVALKFIPNDVIRDCRKRVRERTAV